MLDNETVKQHNSKQPLTSRFRCIKTIIFWAQIFHIVGSGVIGDILNVVGKAVLTLFSEMYIATHPHTKHHIDWLAKLTLWWANRRSAASPVSTCWANTPGRRWPLVSVNRVDFLRKSCAAAGCRTWTWADAKDDRHCVRFKGQCQIRCLVCNKCFVGV